MLKSKVYVVGKSFNYINWMNLKLTDSFEEADVIVFTGGEDVDPSFYGEKVGKFTYYNSDRDFLERKYYDRALKEGKSMIGICRGAQFLTVMSGGKLVQHVDNHGKYHLIKFNDDETHVISSTHHQMMYPYDLEKDDYELIASSYNNRSTTHLNGSNQEINFENLEEPEIVFYNRTNCLCIQGHPEMMNSDSPIISKLQQLIINKLIRPVCC